MLTADENAFIHRVLKGDELAIAFCKDLFQVSQVWDDLYDRDKPVDRDVLNATFWTVMVSIPSNPFYQRHFDVLNPLLQVAMVDWMDSNKLASGEVEHRVAAYVLRDSVSTILIHCARLVGGYNWMREISIEVREALYDEPLRDFMEELKT